MFERDRHGELPHAIEEGDAMAADRPRIVAVLALQRSDRLVLCVRSGWDHVHHRCEVEVDARRTKLLRPDRRPALEGRGGPAALYQRRRHRRKAGSLQRLDQAALLVCRDKESDICGRGARGLGLYCRGDSANRGGSGVATVDEP